MRRLFNNLVSVVFTFVKFCLMKLFLGSSFHFHPVERFSPNVVTEFNRGSCVTIGKKVRVHSGCKIKARGGSVLELEDGVKLNYNCILACHESIRIGAGTVFGPSVYVYDHDHDYRRSLQEDRYLSSPVTIGKECWIGANTVILRGSSIGNHCVIGAGCVIKGKIPPGSVVTQKRETLLRSLEGVE